MRKGLLAICLVLLISLAVLAPSCTQTPTTGTINVNATLDGAPWPGVGTGAVNYTLTPASGANISGTKVPDSFTVDPGSWNCTYVSGGPAASYFVNITPSETQSVTAGGNTTFTLNFATYLASPLDASATFKSWTINGVEVPPGVPQPVYPGDIIDAEYTEHVSGATGAPVTVHQTSWLQVHNIGYDGQEGPTIMLHVLNGLGAVSVDHSAKVSNQKCTVGGLPVNICDMIHLYYCEPVNLDVEVDLKLVVCTNYTKTINWIGFPSPTNILFDIPAGLLAGQYLNLTSYACVYLEGDTNSTNDCTVASPTLTIYSPGP